MRSRCLAIGLLASGCGQVAHTAADAGPSLDTGTPLDGAQPDAGIPRSYTAMLAQTPAVAFGGTPFCNYTITLKQLAITLGIVPSGQVVSGHVEDLNVEAVVQPCTNGVIPANIATYTLKSASPTQTGMSLTFLGATTNVPHADLVVDLSTAGSAYQARLGFHRNDASPPLDWSVVATLALSGQ